MEINYWYLSILFVILVYIVPILLIRIGLNRRLENRRNGVDRRVRFIHVPIERRQNNYDRRIADRRVIYK